MADKLSLPGRGQMQNPQGPVSVDDLALRKWVVEEVNASLDGKFVEDSVFTDRCEAVYKWVTK